jgi:NSS family neurotransmitter:Na+ symporter
VFGVEKKLGVFDLLQVATTQLLLPVGALLLALFAGWAIRVDTSREALALRSPCAYDAWIWLLRLAVPAMLVVLLISLPKLFP